MSEPKVFISYSWTTLSHEQWVLRLATELRESGLDVILDKWDLKEGHDANAFMERIVTDPEVKKVILVCDKAYAEKTNKRSGGVGTEAQIISPEIYAKQTQDKFVAVITELDDDGKAYLPAYYRTRIFIDFSDPSTYAEDFEQLVRWAFNQPIHKRPPIGQKPAFLREEKSVVLGTTTRHRRAMEAIKNAREHAIPAAAEYLELFVSELEKLRVPEKADPFDDGIVNSIEASLPARNEAIEFFLALASYKDTLETRTLMHRFFESMIPYLDRAQNARQWSDWDFDVFKFAVHELYLYALACLIRFERFESAEYLMANDYYIPGNSDYGRDAMAPFSIFRSYLKSLDHRNSRLKLNRLSLRSDLLEQRCKGIGVQFRQLMQADFILFMRSRIVTSELHAFWWPETLLYVGRHAGPFEVFARSKSLRYFNRTRCLLGIEQKTDLDPILKGFAEDPSRVPRWQFESIYPAALLGYKDLATVP